MNPFQGRFRIPKSFVDSLSPPYYELHIKEPLAVDTVPLGRCIAGVARIMIGLLRKAKKKIMVAETFVLFSPVTPEINGGS